MKVSGRSPWDADRSLRRPLAAPGSAGFDPWCLTDPPTRPRWPRDAGAGKAIDSLWRWDPDPRATLEVQAEIDAAVARGVIERTKMHYYCCPWSPIYVVEWPVSIGGKRLRQLQHFTFDVSAEEMGEGGTFKREVLVASSARRIGSTTATRPRAATTKTDGSS